MKKYKYTIFSLLFAVFFIAGSMAAANGMLRHREAGLLTESGGIKAESPVREWEGGKDSGGNAGGKKKSLSAGQVEAAVKSWNDRTGVIWHERMSGQIAMEEAIEKGKTWLVKMGICGKKEAASCGVSAELGVGRQKKAFGERAAYFSFWTVTYSDRSIDAALYLNAVTGKVWGAEIKRYGTQFGKLPDDSLYLFVKLAGMETAEDVSFVADSEGGISAVPIRGSRLYAQEQLYDMITPLKESYKYIAYQFLEEPKLQR